MRYTTNLHAIPFILLSMLSGIQTTSLKAQAVNTAEIVTIKEFPLSEVKLLDGPFKDAMERDIAWLKMLDCNRLLSMFRITSGLPSKIKPYGGWEGADSKMDGIRGHYLGHYLSALSKAYASTGDKEIKTKIDYLVTELSKCQEKYGNGYIGAFPESMFDDLNQGKKVHWVPWYTMHKIFAGLYDVYIDTGNPNAYATFIKLTDWAKKKTDGLTPEAMQTVLKTEQGGMTEALADIYAVTKNPDYLELAKRFDHHYLLDAMSKQQDNLAGVHANTQIPKMIGAAREYEVTSDLNYRKAAEYFWDRVANHRSAVTGGHGINEGFKEADMLDPYLNVSDADETCNAYNMLKLTEHLFSWTGDAAYADFYERTLINCILASQTPDKHEDQPAGMMTYHQPIRPGLWKRFNDVEDCFWCCTGTGSENHVQYGKFIYSFDNEGLYVNLFISSQLTWPEKQMAIKLETNFPEEDNIKLTVYAANPAKTKIRFRVPYWATNGVTVKINGKVQTINVPDPSSYLTIERIWSNKDVVELSMPMSLHKETLPGNDHIAAFLYGPVVLSGKLDDSGLTTDYLYGLNGDQVFDKLNPKPIEIPVFSGVNNDLNSWIKPVKGQKLTFQTIGKGIPTDVTLVPYYKQFFERYSIYWHLCPAIAQQEKPVVYYKFDETNGNVVKNETNSAFNATIEGEATTSPGKNGNAIKLDGKSYIKLPEGIISSLKSFTIAFWVNVAEPTPGAKIFDFGQDNVFHMYIEPNTKDDKFKFAITQFGNAGEHEFSTTALPANTWKNIALSFDGTRCIFYIDGEEAGWNEEMTVNPMMLGVGKNNFIGKAEDKKAPMFNGMLDDFRIWNKPLNAQEIKDLLKQPIN